MPSLVEAEFGTEAVGILALVLIGAYVINKYGPQVTTAVSNAQQAAATSVSETALSITGAGDYDPNSAAIFATPAWYAKYGLTPQPAGSPAAQEQVAFNQWLQNNPNGTYAQFDATYNNPDLGVLDPSSW